jgi:hypothetical protein
MTKKLTQLLVDAVVVIDAHEKKYWEHLCASYEIFLPSTIIEEELLYFTSDKGRQSFEIAKLISQGKVTRIDAEINHSIELFKKISSDFRSSLHAGELEALAILMSKDFPHLFFTTADRAAIKALGVLSLSRKGLSVEELLSNLHGFSRKNKKLAAHFTTQYFRKALSEGFTEQHLWLKPS